MQNSVIRSVGVVCFNKSDPNKVLIVKHGKDANHITGSVGLPSGKIEPGEADIEAAVREFQEETGLKSSVEFFNDLSFPFEPVLIGMKDEAKKFSWHLFLCKDYSGELKGSGETEPEWINLDEIHRLENLLPNTEEAPRKAKEYLKNNSKISLIVAVDQNRGIGKGGKMPWHISADFKRFKEITMGHPVIMGRKTFESIPGPLSGRTNIVITRNHFEQKDSITTNSLEQALEKAKNAPGSNEIFVIGGGQIFQEAINIADKLYLTLVEGKFDVDTYFPDYSKFKKVVFKQDGKEGGFKFAFIDLERGQ